MNLVRDRPHAAHSLGDILGRPFTSEMANLSRQRHDSIVDDDTNLLVIYAGIPLQLGFHITPNIDISFHTRLHGWFTLSFLAISITRFLSATTPPFMISVCAHRWGPPRFRVFHMRLCLHTANTESSRAHEPFVISATELLISPRPPRRASKFFYAVSTPGQLRSMRDNCYCPGISHGIGSGVSRMITQLS